MHISPGVVEGARLTLGYATGAVSCALGVMLSWDTVRKDGGARALLLRSIVTTILVFCFFQVLPHYRVGVSEVHFIFGAMLYVLFGAGPTAIGLAAGLLLQGWLFVPEDLPQYYINVTTLVVPLWIVSLLARAIVAHHTPYVGMKYWQLLVLSLAYQGGVILIVAFWSFYGQGLGADNLSGVVRFAYNYLVVIIVEPLVTLLMLALARKFDHATKSHPIFYRRLHHEVT